MTKTENAMWMCVTDVDYTHSISWKIDFHLDIVIVDVVLIVVFPFYHMSFYFSPICHHVFPVSGSFVFSFRSLFHLFALILLFSVCTCVSFFVSVSVCKYTRAPHENFWLVIDFLSFRLFNTERPYNRFWWTGTPKKGRRKRIIRLIDYLQLQRVHAMRMRRTKDAIRLLISLLF